MYDSAQRIVYQAWVYAESLPAVPECMSDLLVPTNYPP